MSRSHKHTPISGITTARSEKDYKRQRHGQERARERQALQHAYDDIDSPTFELAPYNAWDAPKDGKVWRGDDIDCRGMRK
jgi:hypothetical protein